MKELFDKVCTDCSRNVTKTYSTSFSLATRMLSKNIRQDIYNIYGSADVVGLMCLKVFVQGDTKMYEELKPYAISLGSAFQKVNFLRDYKADLKELNRTYFPNLVNKSFDDAAKKKILNEIKDDFAVALKGIYMLPNNSKFGVYAAYKYYKRLLKKLDKTSSSVIKNKRVRVPNYQKVDVLARSYVRYRLNIL